MYMWTFSGGDCTAFNMYIGYTINAHNHTYIHICFKEKECLKKCCERTHNSQTKNNDTNLSPG